MTTQHLPGLARVLYRLAMTSDTPRPTLHQAGGPDPAAPHPAGTALAQAANARGMAAIRAGNGQAAIAAFAEAVRADPAAAALWLNLAHGYRLTADAVGERQALDSALAIDRTDFVGQLRLAQLLQRVGPEREAMAAWELAIGIADQAGPLPPGIVAEIAAGRRYVTDLRTRYNTAIEAAFAGVEDTVTDDDSVPSETIRRRLAALVEQSSGRRRAYQNQCAGLHYPFLPADEFFDRLHFPCFDDLEAHAGIIAAELDALLQGPRDLLRPYVQMADGLPANIWSGLDNSDEWSACFLWEYGKANQPVLDRCPQTAALLARLPLLDLPGRGPNAFFSLLAPGGYIPPHTGVTNTRAIVHLALDIPGEALIRVGGDKRRFVAGKAFAFDDTIEHEVWNNAPRARSVLIMDFWNPHLSRAERQAIGRYFAASDQAIG